MRKPVEIIIVSSVIIWAIISSCVTSANAQNNLQWQPFERALVMADSTNQPVFIDVWAPWCGWCRKMKQEVYPQLETQLNRSFILTRLNRDDNDTIHQYRNRELTSMKLAKLLHTEEVPAIVILNPTGEYLLHLSGFIEASKLQTVLKYIATESYKTKSFEVFKQAENDKKKLK